MPGLVYIIIREREKSQRKRKKKRRKEMKKVYVVSGAYVNYVGVFENKVEAEEVAEKINFNKACGGSNDRVHVKEVELNDRQGW